MICRRCFISGRVQGVFFRDSARRVAIRLGLCGWVRNRHDRRVEVLAAGEPAQLREFEKWLQTGPERAKVTNIECIDIPCDKNDPDWQGGFHILPTA